MTIHHIDGFAANLTYELFIASGIATQFKNLDMTKADHRRRARATIKEMNRAITQALDTIGDIREAVNRYEKQSEV